MDVTVTGGDKLDKFTSDLRKHAGSIEPLLIGWFKTAKYPDGKQIAEIAIHQEFGAPNNRLGKAKAPIPARPTMRPAMQQLRKEMTKLVKGFAERTLDDKERFFRDLPDWIGARGAGLIQKNFATLTSPPLSPVTIYFRTTRKVNRTSSEKPLIDTGAMRLAISWQKGNSEPKKVSDHASRI